MLAAKFLSGASFDDEPGNVRNTAKELRNGIQKRDPVFPKRRILGHNHDFRKKFVNDSAHGRKSSQGSPIIMFFPRSFDFRLDAQEILPKCLFRRILKHGFFRHSARNPGLRENIHHPLEVRRQRKKIGLLPKLLERTQAFQRVEWVIKACCQGCVDAIVGEPHLFKQEAQPALKEFL
jgi:hypothetical protein